MKWNLRETSAALNFCLMSAHTAWADTKFWDAWMNDSRLVIISLEIPTGPFVSWALDWLAITCAVLFPCLYCVSSLLTSWGGFSPFFASPGLTTVGLTFFCFESIFIAILGVASKQLITILSLLVGLALPLICWAPRIACCLSKPKTSTNGEVFVVSFFPDVFWESPEEFLPFFLTLEGAWETFSHDFNGPFSFGETFLLFAGGDVLAFLVWFSPAFSSKGLFAGSDDELPRQFAGLTSIF